MFKNSEVYQIYEHIAGICGHPDPAEACRLVINFCKDEMDKIDGSFMFPDNSLRVGWGCYPRSTTEEK